MYVELPPVKTSSFSCALPDKIRVAAARLATERAASAPRCRRDPMQALAEARVPDAAESREYQPSALLWWGDAVQYIVDNRGCSQKDAFFILSDAISFGVVEAVNGYKEPLPPRHFPDRLVEEFDRGTKLEISDPPSYPKQWQRPDLEIYIKLNTLQKLCSSRPGINSEACEQTPHVETTQHDMAEAPREKLPYIQETIKPVRVGGSFGSEDQSNPSGDQANIADTPHKSVVQGASFVDQLEDPQGKPLPKTRVTQSLAQDFAKRYIDQTRAKGRQATQKGIVEAARQAGIKGGRELLRQALVDEVGHSARARGRPPKNNSPK
jgi:hypothetical protein